MFPTFAKSQRGYEAMFASATLLPSRRSEAHRAAQKIISLRPHYEAVEKATDAWWLAVGAMHYRECSNNMRGCLANGELIVGTGRRTRLVPAGRGPYKTFEESGIDAIKYEGLSGKGKWSVPYALWASEKLNGGGYQARGVNSPYDWAGTSKQQPGKYIADGVWSSTAMDSQLGVAAIYKAAFEIDPSLEPGKPIPAPVVVSAGGAAVTSIVTQDPAMVVGAIIAVIGVLLYYHIRGGSSPMNAVSNAVFTNWKTTFMGALPLVSAIIHMINPAIPGADLATSLGLFLTGLVAKDSNVTGGTVKQ